jgi:ribosomal protein S18 acetylase RimI-like enzyme
MTLEKPIAEIRISRASADDASSMAEVHVASWRAGYKGIVPEKDIAAQSVDVREKYWREAIEKGTPQIEIAWLHDAVAGWVAWDSSRDPDAPEGTGEIWSLYVDPRHWRKGIGRELMRYANERLVEAGYMRVSLWVLTENVRAIAFYLDAGFVPESFSTKPIAMSGETRYEIRYVARLGS